MADERMLYTCRFLVAHPEVFDRRVNPEGGRVRWGGAKPVGYDGKAGLPWHRVRGRYWYPYRYLEYQAK